MKTSAMTLMLAAALAAVPLAGQQTPRERALEVMSSTVFERLEALARDAADEGIPPDPLFNKALEGMAKHVPPDLLLQAVSEYSGRLRVTHQAFGPPAEAPLLMAGADALQRGVPVDALRSMGERGTRSPMAVLVLADLVETGVPSGQALGVIQEAMGRRMRDERMLDIPEQVRRLMREGHTPGAAAERVWRGMRRGGGGPPAP